MDITNPDTVEQFAARQLRRQVQRVADRLDDLAERVRRSAEDVPQIGTPGRSTYAGVAADVQHEIMTALMNLSLSSLITSAADADIARAKGE